MDAKQWAEELKRLSENGKFEVALSGNEAIEIATLLEVEPPVQGGSGDGTQA